MSSDSSNAQLLVPLSKVTNPQLRSGIVILIVSHFWQCWRHSLPPRSPWESACCCLQERPFQLSVLPRVHDGQIHHRAGEAQTHNCCGRTVGFYFILFILGGGTVYFTVISSLHSCTPSFKTILQVQEWRLSDSVRCHVMHFLYWFHLLILFLIKIIYQKLILLIMSLKHWCLSYRCGPCNSQTSRRAVP